MLLVGKQDIKLAIALACAKPCINVKDINENHEVDNEGNEIEKKGLKRSFSANDKER